MASLNVNMPDELREDLDRVAAEEKFATPTELVRHIIRDYLVRRERLRIEAQLAEALGREEYEEVTRDFVDELRQRVSSAREGGAARAAKK